MKNEQQFMMIFRFTPNPNFQPTPEQEKEMHEQWGSFIGNIAIQEKLVSTHQLGFEGKLISANKEVSEGISLLENQTPGGNMIVRANSIDEATEMAKNCPILLMGGSVEVRNINPMN
ncbi:MAG: YciI family protein [Flavobacteriales bacterium]